MSAPDPTMSKIAEGIELAQRGEREKARVLFTSLWAAVGPNGDPFYLCSVAHSMADVQDAPEQELAWDLRALEAAELVTEERLDEAGVGGTVQALYPSLHLNLGDVYRRLGDFEQAEHHLMLGRAAAHVLGDDGYSRMIKGGLDRLAARLAER
jgi:hypothetical protein